MESEELEDIADPALEDLLDWELARSVWDWELLDLDWDLEEIEILMHKMIFKNLFLFKNQTKFICLLF